MKYEIGDKVIHCRNGVSTIVGMKEMMERQYFVIHALRGDKENIYVNAYTIENDNINLLEITEEEKNKVMKEIEL